jgi:hypothetical protein
MSKYISNQIAKQFKGDRSAAEKYCNSKMKKEIGISSSKKLGLFYGLCLNTEKLSASDKAKLKKFIQEKVGKNEYEYIQLCNQIKFNYTF